MRLCDNGFPANATQTLFYWKMETPEEDECLTPLKKPVATSTNGKNGNAGGNGSVANRDTAVRGSASALTISQYGIPPVHSDSRVTMTTEGTSASTSRASSDTQLKGSNVHPNMSRSRKSAAPSDPFDFGKLLEAFPTIEWPSFDDDEVDECDSRTSAGEQRVNEMAAHIIEDDYSISSSDASSDVDEDQDRRRCVGLKRCHRCHDLTRLCYEKSDGD